MDILNLRCLLDVKVEITVLLAYIENCQHIRWKAVRELGDEGKLASETQHESPVRRSKPRLGCQGEGEAEGSTMPDDTHRPWETTGFGAAKLLTAALVESWGNESLMGMVSR